VWLYERLFPRGYWEGKRGGFDAPKSADQPVESAREKSRKREVKKPLIDPSVSLLREPLEPIRSA
jgi:hypothetical protein